MLDKVNKPQIVAETKKGKVDWQSQSEQMYGAQAGKPGDKTTVTVGAAAADGKAPKAGASPTRAGQRKGAPVKEAIPMSDEAIALKVALQAAQENVQHYKERARLLSLLIS